MAAPEKPAHIAANPVASAEWDRVVPMLVEQRVLTDAFRVALEAYVLSYADVVQGEAIKASPRFRPFGKKPHPVLKAVNEAKKELRQWAGVLGLLPTTVGKVSGAPQEPQHDEDEALLARLEGRPAFEVVSGGKR